MSKIIRLAKQYIFKILLLGISAGTVQAATFYFVGDLRADANFTSCGDQCTLGAGNSDGDYAQWAALAVNFNVPVTSQMSAITFSYGGGVNGNGTVIAPNGFEPYLSLFDPSGTFLASTFFGTTCPVGANTNSTTQQCYDVGLDGGVLSPGTYSIAISAFENLSFAENTGSGTLADGFTGLGNLAPGEDLHYAFDVVLKDASPIPEPATFYLTVCAVLLLFLTGKRRIGSSTEGRSR
jgi:hypothetical protein